MKFLYKFFGGKLVLAFLMAWALSACELDQLSDPNNPSVDLVNNATIAEIQNLVSGIESGMRGSLGNYYDVVNMIGREYWRFSGSDPRFTGDLLGKGSSVLDNNTFYLTNPYGGRYQVVKNTNLLIEAVEKTKAALSDAQKKHILGFAKTIQAYQLSLVLNQLHDNGIRTEVKDFNNLGPFRSRTEAHNDISALLDQAFADLSTAGATTFAITLSSGFAGFNTPATFAQFNRALAARIALYRADYAGALTRVGQSFINPAGSLNTGVFHFFSTAGGDITNVLFFPRNASSETRVVHPSFIADATMGDTRVTAKAALRDDGSDADALPDPATQDGLSGIYDFWLYQSQSAFIPIIRNEELILIRAEARIQINTDLVGATADLNIVRAAAGLAPLAGGLSQAQLIDAMLRERRYSLFGEGHRWVDMRRYSRLAQLTIDRAGDDVFTQFPRPANDQ